MNLKEKIAVGMTGLAVLTAGCFIGNALYEKGFKEGNAQGQYTSFSRGAAAMAVGTINSQENTHYSWEEVEMVEDVANSKTYEQIKSYLKNLKNSKKEK